MTAIRLPPPSCSVLSLVVRDVAVQEPLARCGTTNRRGLLCGLMAKVELPRTWLNKVINIKREPGLACPGSLCPAAPWSS